MRIQKTAKAGTLESNDIFIIVDPIDGNGVEIELTSIVFAQFGKQIEKVLRETAGSINIEGIKITANDRGALDYTIQSRLETAVKRAL